MSGEADALRLDRWLWHARCVASRALVIDLVSARRVRLNNQIVTKTHALVRPGDILVLTQAARIRVLKIRDLGRRRGPAREASTLYEELAGLD